MSKKPALTPWVICHQNSGQKTVTEKPAYWVLPPPVKSITYARVKDINFFKKPQDFQNNKC